jgi:tripartite ATP-independent transporter DctM subunit
MKCFCTLRLIVQPGAVERPAALSTLASSESRTDLFGWLAALALALMVAIPVVEIAARPLMGQGIDNASVVVQHLGLLMAMAGAVAAARRNELSTVLHLPERADQGLGQPVDPLWVLHAVALSGSAFAAAVLARASWTFVMSEMDAGTRLAYGIPVWAIQFALPAGFALISVFLGRRLSRRAAQGWALALALLGAGWLGAEAFEGTSPIGTVVAVAMIVAMLLAGAPIFACLGALAVVLMAGEGLPLASVPLSHYQITVNPSLPALPLFTLAGIVVARTGAAARVGRLLQALFGDGPRAVAIAAALLCSGFTALTGGSGVTILALGGLLYPMLTRAGYPERRAIGLLTGASALGVLIAPSVPLVLYAVIARVPIQEMFVAGLLPAAIMIVCLLGIGGYFRKMPRPAPMLGGADLPLQRPDRKADIYLAAKAAGWELLIPVIAVGSIAVGIATPTESAALTAAFVVLSQGLVHRELTPARLGLCLADSARLIGGVMLILGMALALTNWLTDVGAPAALVDWVRERVDSPHLFMLALLATLFVAAALLEIYAAIVVLVPLLLPLAQSYGIDPVHFGLVFMAAMEVGFICPPAGMNLYFASAMFGKPLLWTARAALPSLLAIMLGTLVVAFVVS